MSILNKIKIGWKRLGQPDFNEYSLLENSRELTEKEFEEMLRKEANQMEVEEKDIDLLIKAQRSCDELGKKICNSGKKNKNSIVEKIKNNSEGPIFKSTQEARDLIKNYKVSEDKEIGE